MHQPGWTCLSPLSRDAVVVPVLLQRRCDCCPLSMAFRLPEQTPGGATVGTRDPIARISSKMLHRRRSSLPTPAWASRADSERRRRRRCRGAGAALTIAWSTVVLVMLAVTNSGTSPRQPQVLTSDRFIYDEQNAPFLNETVAEYRTRLNSVDIDDDDTIFVSIATYRDDACPGTIQTMMTAASRPDRVFVGLVDQTNLDDPHTDDIQCHARLPDDIRKRVRLVRMRHVNARGPTHARHIASKLWDGERFFLMIDAHSTFRDGWDRILIDNIRQLPNPSKAVISHVNQPGCCACAYTIDNGAV